MKQNEQVCDKLEAKEKSASDLANDLERYNRWRRGEEGIEQPNPTELGMLIDEVVKLLRS